MNNKDDFTRFMLLYGVFYHIFQSQREVDEFIWRLDDTEAELTSTKSSTIQETIYTYLRNQVGHTQENSDFEEVVVKMGNCVRKLSEYVKAAIKEELN